jgi:hypothetical protein
MIEKAVTQQVTVLEDGQLQVLTITAIVEDGKEIARNNHRKVVAPGDDISGEVGLVKEVAEKIHTKERKDAFTAKRAKQEELVPEQPV